MKEFKAINKIQKLRVGLIGVENIKVVKKNDKLWKEIQNLSSKLREKYRLESVSSISRVEQVRKLYKSTGMDPFRYRPSSEALLRRVLKGESIYQINSVVDINNFCSLEELLPMGVYDADKIHGTQLIFRLGNIGEKFEGIGKATINAEGKIVMVNEQKICGGPTADSVETMITLDTKNVLITIYAPEVLSQSLLKDIYQKTSNEFIKFNGGKLTFVKNV